MYSKQGQGYHWIPELYRRMNLPVFDGVQQALVSYNQRRHKSDKQKRRRLQLKIERTRDAQQRKNWSKKHGHDTYYDLDDAEDEPDLAPSTSRVRHQVSNKQCKACGSTTHQRSTHRDCPFNKGRGTVVSTPVCDANQLVDGDILPDCDDCVTDGALPSEGSESSDDEGLFEDNIVSGMVCTCGASGRAHNKTCPLNPRNLHSGFSGRVLFGPAEADGSHNPVLHVPDDTSLEPPNEPPAKKRKASGSFKAGDYVCIQNKQLGGKHLVCRVVQETGGLYQLCCKKGVLSYCYSGSELMATSTGASISLDKWRVAPKVSMCSVRGDSDSLEQCSCDLNKLQEDPCTVVHLSDDSDTAAYVWVQCPLYSLTLEDKKDIMALTGWLSDSIITAAQRLMSSTVSGLEPPVLQQTLSFQRHTGEFVQILHVGNCHWCVVSNMGCEEGVVHVYDSSYTRESAVTLRVIASLLYVTGPKMVVKVMNTQRQCNGSDCGVFAIANAYELCCGFDPCKAKFDHKPFRQHLAKCMETQHMSRFPLSGERVVGSRVRSSQSVDLHCSCRMPEAKGDEMASCDGCGQWFHKHCQDIPNEVFSSADDVPWLCSDPNKDISFVASLCSG